MSRVIGIVNCDNTANNVAMLKYRSAGAVSFLGRYRMVDFVLSNMTNSGIQEIKVLVNENPHSIIEHIGDGSQYNINTKRGRLELLFPQEDYVSPIYNTDVSMLNQNMRHLDNKLVDYVVIAPSHMLYSINFKDVIDAHEKSGAAMTVVYKNVNDANVHFADCQCLTLDEEKRITKLERNHGNRKNRSVSLETYVINRDMFVTMLEVAAKESALYTLKDVIEDLYEDTLINGYQFKGYAKCINNLKDYYDASMELIDYDTARLLVKRDWPIYTKTNDSVPTLYTKNAEIRKSVISNGCEIDGTVENSVIGRNVMVRKGAVIRNSVIMADTVIGENVVLDGVVVDKDVIIKHPVEIKGTADNPTYIKRGDVL